MKEAVLAKKVGNPFTYSWILILIALVGWMEPTHYQGMETKVVNVCRGVQYKNLWALNKKERKINNIIQFYIYLDHIESGSGKDSATNRRGHIEVPKNCKYVECAPSHMDTCVCRPREVVADNVVESQ